MLAGHAGEDLEVLEAPLRTGVADLLVTKNHRIVVLRRTLQNAVTCNMAITIPCGVAEHHRRLILCLTRVISVV